jgi:hypothetical protein
MRRDQGSTFLSAVFVDYDNIYMSLKRKSDEAAKRFAKEAHVWLKAIENGSLITPTNGPGAEGNRRIVMNRCYGNPVPRRNASDNSTDMSSFPFVRHHFLRAGFEIVDCPPLTAQLKNSSDIRMVMDVRDYLTHPTYFDEFIILSGDADFTPVLHRLRAHARRTVIFANDYTAAPYTAISDGEVRESDLVRLLLEGRIGQEAAETSSSDPALIEAIRRDIIADVVTTVRSAAAPVPLEVLADRAVRAVGHDRTIGTAWAGAGGFRELLSQSLPEGMRLSGEPPYVVIDTSRHIAVQSPQPALPEPNEARIERAMIVSSGNIDRQKAAAAPLTSQPVYAAQREPAARPSGNTAYVPQPQPAPAQPAPLAPAATAKHPPAPRSPGPALQSASFQQIAASGQDIAPPAPPLFGAPARNRIPEAFAPAPVQNAAPPARPADQPSSIQQSIARIHEACQAPPLAPPEYRVLFEVMAQEINENGLIGAQTILNIAQRALERGVEARRDDVRFILEVVSEADPWFEQGASANLFAGRFRNFVVARCRSQGLTLSADELDLIEAWFAGNGAPITQRQIAPPVQPAAAARPPVAQPALDPTRPGWNLDESHQAAVSQRQVRTAMSNPAEQAGDDFPRIVRTRLRG